MKKPCANCGEMTTGTRPYRDVTDTDRGDWVQEGEEPYCGCDDEPMQNTSKYTPGPWKAGRPDMQTLIEGYGGKYIYSHNSQPPKYVAAAIGSEVREWEEVIANAHLIAAAPEMLTVLRQAKEYIENLQFPDAGWAHVLDLTVAAIAKAEGRS